MASNPNLSGNFGVSGVAMDLIPIVPNDSTDLAVTARAIRCRPDGAAGTLRFTAWTGEVRNTAIAAGELLPVPASRVHSSGTTATGLEAVI